VTLLSDKGKTIIALKHKLFLKERNISRMEDDAAYVPVSARVKFKLQAWKKLEVSPDFTTLARETANLITQFQLQLKVNIIENIRLEHTVITAKRNNLCVDSLAVVTSLYLTALGQNANNTHIVALALIHQYEYTLPKHCGMSDEEVAALYRTFNNVPPDILATSAMAGPKANIRRTL
jgi:hypothetical protein